MKIRIAKNEDVEQVWNIGNNVSEFRTAENVVIFWPKETLENCINKDDILFYVVETENKIIGFSIVNLNKSLGKAEIENIYVLPEYRKNKIGTAILDEILRELKNRKYNISLPFFLIVKQQNFMQDMDLQKEKILHGWI